MGGAGCLTHGEKNEAEVDKYGRGAMEKTISDALCVLPRKTECNDNKNSKAHLCGEFFFLTNLARGIIVLLSTRQKGKNEQIFIQLLLLFWLTLTPQRKLSILSMPAKMSDSFANRFFNRRKYVENLRFSRKYK